MYFANFYKLRFSEVFLTEAKALLEEVKLNWEENKIFFQDLVRRLFPIGYSRSSIRVCVLPPRFRIGACETKKRLILFGQPIRSKNFSSALIAHEIIHIFLSKLKGKRNLIVDEVICLLVEELFYLKEGKTLDEIWKKEESDCFHEKAQEIATKYRNQVNIRSQVKVLVSLLQRKLDRATLEIVPPAGLMKNLSSRSKKLLVP